MIALKIIFIIEAILFVFATISIILKLSKGFMHSIHKLPYSVSLTFEYVQIGISLAAMLSYIMFN